MKQYAAIYATIFSISVGLQSARPVEMQSPPQAALDLRVPMTLAANAVALRLDPAADYRPWFLIRGSHGVPHDPAHDVWDFGDMTGRYLETLIHARSMGIASPTLSLAEERLGRYLLSLIGSDGLVHRPDTAGVDNPFSHGSALFGLLAWYESTGNPTARNALDRMIHGLRSIAEDHGEYLTYADAKLPESPGSHLAGYQIFPIVRYYELTGNPEALALAEGLTRWAIEHDPVIGSDGAITKPLSWEGHIHSWFETLAGCLRTARNSRTLDHAKVLQRCRSVYDWVRRTNSTDFGWFATYPTGGSCETCAISSAIRLALELWQAGHPEYLNDVERFVRNQVIEAQFRDLPSLSREGVNATPLLLGVFDSQSMPNSHLGTRGGEDVGNVEGCCLNGGTRAIYLAWQNAVTVKKGDVYVNLGISRDSPWVQVIDHQPAEGRLDVRIRYRARNLFIRVPDWADHKQVAVLANGQQTRDWSFSGDYVKLRVVKPDDLISVTYPLRHKTEDVTAGGKRFRIAWQGDTVVSVGPPGERDQLYQRGATAVTTAPAKDTMIAPPPSVPDTYFLQNAAVAAAENILARLDPQRNYQPFFRIMPFADPPYAEHGKWDDGDMAGRYVEALISARQMTGVPMDPREQALRRYLASVLDPHDGLAYTQQTEWTPRRACMFSQSCVMLGLLAWYDETNSSEVRTLLDNHVNGLMKLAVARDNYVLFPKYEFDGKAWIDEPKGKEAPAWYGGRILCPLVEYYKRWPRPEVKEFIEKLIHYSIEVNQSIRPDGEVTGAGEGWWAHLHGTQDMVAGIAEYARIAEKPDWLAWSKRVYDWVGRTNTSRFGWNADCSGSSICETCTIAARFRLGLVLYRAGLVDPFSEMDRFTRNQLMENQFADLSFMKPMQPQTPRTAQKCYTDVDRMLLGAFQCWGTANDLIGHEDVEGCGAGGGMQALAFAWQHAVEWKTNRELWVHLLFNRRVGLGSNGPVGPGSPLAAEILSELPYAGRVTILTYRSLAFRIRIPDGSDTSNVRVNCGGVDSPATVEDGYVWVPKVTAGQRIVLTFPLKSYETEEPVAGKTYRVTWKGSTVLALEPRGEKMPLYTRRAAFRADTAPTCVPRYP